MKYWKLCLIFNSLWVGVDQGSCTHYVDRAHSSSLVVGVHCSKLGKHKDESELRSRQSGGEWGGGNLELGVGEIGVRKVDSLRARIV